MLIATVFTILPNWKPTSPSTRKLICKLQYINKMQHYLAMKR